MKHFTSALLAALMLAALASCGDTSADTTVDNKTTATVTFTFPGGKEFKAKLYAKVQK